MNGIIFLYASHLFWININLIAFTVLFILVKTWGNYWHYERFWRTWNTCTYWTFSGWYKIYGDPRWTRSCHSREEGRDLISDLSFILFIVSQTVALYYPNVEYLLGLCCLEGIVITSSLGVFVKLVLVSYLIYGMFCFSLQGSGGATVKKTNMALVIGIYEEPMTPGQCNMIVERLGDYLIDQGL